MTLTEWTRAVDGDRPYLFRRSAHLTAWVYAYWEHNGGGYRFKVSSKGGLGYTQPSRRYETLAACKAAATTALTNLSLGKQEHNAARIEAWLKLHDGHPNPWGLK